MFENDEDPNVSDELGNVKDKRGREWEIFIDLCYFDMTCVRWVGDRDFDSQLSFHFNTLREGKEFLKLIEKSS